MRVLQALLGRTDEDLDEISEKFVDKSDEKTTNDAELAVKSFPGLAIPPAAPIFTGGGAVVVQCIYEQQPTIRYAIKVTRPSLLGDKDSKAVDEQKAARLEFLQHAPLIHRNVARMFATAKLFVRTPQKEREVAGRAIQIEWINEAKPLREFIAERAEKEKLTWKQLIDLLQQCLAGLGYLHSKNLVHWDVKSENFLVDGDGTPRLTDIGNARPIGGVGAEKRAFSTYWNLPPALVPARRSHGESFRRVGIKVPGPQWDASFLDLWMFARDLNRLFDADADVRDFDTSRNPDTKTYREQRQLVLMALAGDEESEYRLRYLQLILRRILWQKNPSEPGYYTNATEIAADLAKLERTLGGAFSVPELEVNPQHVVRIPVAGNVAFTTRISKLLNSRMVSRLTKHGQLAAVPLVYPGATHRRSEHSVGVYATTIAYVRALYSDRTNPFWRATVSARDIEALLLASFVHDIGHIAFGHLLEEMTGLIGANVHEAYALAALDGTGTAVGDELDQDGRDLGALVGEDWAKGGDEDVKNFLALVRQILEPPAPVWNEKTPLELTRCTSDVVKIRILHSIISSAIDADKLDYLERDAHHCNVQYPKGIDTERFFQALTTVLITDTRPKEFRACVAVSEKGIAPLESILIARYQMFATVYWQHTVRTLTSMLQYAVQEYVAAQPNDSDVRLHEVITEFRKRSDREALVWLKQVLTVQEHLAPNVKTRVEGICDALLSEGPRTYRTAFELRYEGASPSGRRVAEAFVSVWDGLHSATDPHDYVTKWRVFRQNISHLLALRLGLPETTFRPGDLLIDIPPKGKDQVEDVFVVMGGDPRPVQHVSPMADGVSEAFRYWVRKPRVFIARDKYKEFVGLGIAQNIRGTIWQVLEKVSRQADPQQMLLDLDLSGLTREPRNLRKR